MFGAPPEHFFSKFSYPGNIGKRIFSKFYYPGNIGHLIFPIFPYPGNTGNMIFLISHIREILENGFYNFLISWKYW